MLSLREFTDKDAQAVACWAEDERTMRFWSADQFDHYPLCADDILSFYNKILSHGDRVFRFVAEEDGCAVGHFLLREFDREHHFVRIGFVILAPCARGKGYGKKMMKLAVDFAVSHLDARRITLGVFTNNPAAYGCYRSLGFQKDPAKIDKMHTFFGEEWICTELELRV